MITRSIRACYPWPAFSLLGLNLKDFNHRLKHPDGGFVVSVDASGKKGLIISDVDAGPFTPPAAVEAARGKGTGWGVPYLKDLRVVHEKLGKTGVGNFKDAMYLSVDASSPQYRKGINLVTGKEMTGIGQKDAALLRFVKGFAPGTATASAAAAPSKYKAQVKWGKDSDPWVDQGEWLIGGRKDQAVVGVNIKSADGGKTLTGTVTYAGEGPIAFKAEASPAQPNYKAQVKWGEDSNPWVDQGGWVIGGRKDQAVIGLQVESPDGGKTLTGTTTYAGEGPIAFKAVKK